MHSRIIPAFLAAVVIALPAGAQKATKAHKATTSAKSWAPAGAWRSVYNDTSVNVAVDASQTRREADGTYRVRLRWQYATNQMIGRAHAYRTMVDRKLIDCATQRFKPISAETYDAAGKRVSGYDTPASAISQIDWAKREPDTSAGKAYAAVCSAIKP